MPGNAKTALPALALAATVVALTACNTMPMHEPKGVQAQTPSAEPVQAAPAPAPQKPAARPTGRAEYADAWHRIRDGLVFEQTMNARVRSQLDWYARNQAYLDRVAVRATPYLHYITDAIERRGMPLDIALLPIVESAFQPFAYSHGRAAGIWQFIPGTGRRFGLKQNWWYDGRRDITAATEAALDYLQMLAQRYQGDWLLALAAYNCGEGNVDAAIRRNRRKGKPTDYWSLDLPRETRGYLPKLLAVAAIVKDPARHGVTLSPVPDEPYFKQVDTGGQIDLAVAADMADVGIEELYRLNPGFNRWATDPDGPHSLLVPVANAVRLSDGLADLPAGERVRWQRHRIREGETLSQIAERYDTTVAVLKRNNRLRGNMIRAGKHLLIPLAREDAEHYALSADARLDRTRQAAGENTVRYTVQPGDSLWEIARAHGTGVRKLAAWNGMAPTDVLKPGRELVLRTTAGGKAVSPAAATQKIHYTVRRGDSLYLISQRFNVAVADLQRWNNIRKNSYLQPGQRLELYVHITGQSENT